MSTFAVVHGAGDSGWSWSLVAAELRARGHTVSAPDLPIDRDATLDDYADVVADSVTGSDGVIVVGHSFGGFTAPLVVDRVGAAGLVFVAGMVPRPGETPTQWWVDSGYSAAAHEQAQADGGLTGNADPSVCYFHDVPRPLAEEALRHERDHPSPAAMAAPWPLDALPRVPTMLVLGTEDRFFPAPFMRRLARERLGVAADELVSGHCPALSRPGELAQLLHRFSATTAGPS